MRLTLHARLSPFADRRRPVVDSASWSADGRWVVCSSEDGDAVVYDALAGAERARIPRAGAAEDFCWVSMAPSGGSFLIGPSWGAGEVRRWSLDGERLPCALTLDETTHSARLVTDTLLVDARQDTSDGEEGPWALWRHDLRGASATSRPLSHHSAELRTWSIDVDAGVLLTGDRDGCVGAWGLADGALRWSAPLGIADVCDVVPIPGTGRVAAVLRDGPLVSLSLADGQIVARSKLDIHNYACLAALDAGHLLVAVFGVLVVVAADTLDEVESHLLPGSVSGITVAGEGQRRWLLGTTNDSVLVYALGG